MQANKAAGQSRKEDSMTEGAAEEWRCGPERADTHLMCGEARHKNEAR